MDPSTESLMHMPNAFRYWSEIPLYMKILAVNALPIAYVTAELVDGYNNWHALGQGGLPHNFLGYLINLVITVVFAKRDTKGTECYRKPERYAMGWGEAGKEERERVTKGWGLGKVGRRGGEAGEAKWYVAPQREHYARRGVDPQLKTAYFDGFTQLADKHTDSLAWSTSVLERHGQALFLKESYSIPTLIAKCKREVAHIHESDLSAHVLLSFADAKRVIEEGWGERHRLTGTRFLPLGYTMLYAPRDKGEVEVLLGILEAGMRYAESNGKAS
ncbi:uncharacterized protein LTR77_000160 [Saxophila tyrrhenica]|uniref:Luciferase domain-containing protein n=1 Tax=Saxophila tyrrhenica TaxID=1690608 RepID=A0AAV9PLX0_9PEZI|nr:hypothetical protein LTR77_000160 [Saxophila tyrrhenica]